MAAQQTDLTVDDQDVKTPVDPNVPKKPQVQAQAQPNSPLVDYGMQQQQAANNPVMPASGNTGVAGGPKPDSSQPQVLSSAPDVAYSSSGSQKNQYGVDETDLRSQIDRALPNADQATKDYYFNKAKQPDLFSDGQWRVGWNDYWKARALNPGSSSADPRLAGTEGIIAAPPGFVPNRGSGWSPSGGDGGQSGQHGRIWDFLMNQLNQSKMVDRKDPIIANQVNAFDAAQERGVRDNLRMAAEAAGPTGNINQERRMAEETRGQNTGAFQAQAMQQELTARRNEIQQALSGALGYISDQDKMELTRQLAELDNAFKYANLGQNAYEFDQTNQFRNSPLYS